MPEAEDSNNTTTRWRTFHRTLDWFHQRYPGATDKWAYGELHHALLMAICGLSEGVPIDKFRYPWGSRMVDLVDLIRNGWLTFEGIQWPKVECNLDWLDRDWPLPAPEADAAVPAESSAVLPTRDNEAAAESARAIAAGSEADETEQRDTPPTESRRVEPMPPTVASEESASPAQGTPARQELVSEWPSAEQLGIVRAPKQKAILRKWPGLCRRYPKIYNVDKVRAGEVSGRRLAADIGDVDPKTARTFLADLRVWFEQRQR